MLSIVVASNFVSWPRSGGLDDQDPDFMDDLLLYLQDKAWLKYERDNPMEARAIRREHEIEDETENPKPLSFDAL